MTIEIEFVGAAQEVTGSRHLVRTSKATILLDCGLFQGHRKQARAKNERLGFDVRELTAVVLSHAHIDHSGALPMLHKLGYRGPIYATPATQDLCGVMLADAAMIQASDARFLNRAIESGQAEGEPITPLYSQLEVDGILRQMVGVPYRMRQQLVDGVWLTFFDAGHVLGSAVVVLDIDDEGERKRLVFTGDLGRHHLPILRDPEAPPDANMLIMESTYGDRLHPSVEQMEENLAEIVKRAHARGGKVIIPSFALERAQEVIFSIRRLRDANLIPKIDVYVDSPLTTSITEIFRRHPDCYDEQSRELLSSADSLFSFDGLHFTSDVESSKELTRAAGPAVIISASGMCEAGRILHHLRAAVEDPRNVIVIVGFMAEHTLGRRIVERRPRLKIFGVERELRAEVAVLNGFSAHADQAGLVDFAKAVANQGRLQQVALVHGESSAQRELSQQLTAAGLPNVVAPAAGTTLRL